MRHKALVILTAVALATAVATGAAGCAGDGVAVAETAAIQGSSSETLSTSTGAATTDDDTVTADSATPATAGATGEISATETDAQTAAVASGAVFALYDEDDLNASWDDSTATHVTLSGGSLSVDGAGATTSGSTLTITSAGTYVLSGTLDEGQVIVAAGDDDLVRLVLSDAEISCSTSAPIYVRSADKVILTLADGTDNLVSDGDSHIRADSETGEPNAAVFSKDDLTINGSGSLTVTARYNDGIASKDDLKIVSGDITVDAANDALQGRDCLGILDGTLTIIADGDGLQATNADEAGKGYISIEGGRLTITAGADAVQAQTTLSVSGGEFFVSTTGGVGSDEAQSSKGLKAGTGVYVTGGTLAIDTADDSIHSNGDVIVAGGGLTITSGDDGIHADASLQVDGGEIDIVRSYEGLEAAVMTINGGTIHIQSSDDGINVAGGADGSSVDGRQGQNMFAINESNQLYINGGYIAIDSGGDGLDCNGRAFMTDGLVLVNGPTNDGNGAMDYMGEFTVSGGFLVAVGSSGMAQAPSETSSLYSIMLNFSQTQQAGTLLHIESQDSENVLTFAPTKQFQSVVVCSSAIQDGTSYSVYLGGSSTGTATDGLYTDGTYTPGAEYVSLDIAGVVTVSGTGGGMRGSGGMPSGRR